MKPLNQAERKKAFGNFLLFFVITIAVIVTTVFFSIRVPFAENKKMKQQVDVYKANELFTNQFSGKVTDLQTLIDRLQTPNIQTDRIRDSITLAISDLQSFKEKSIAGNDNIYAKMIDALYKLNVANSNLVRLRDQSPDLGSLQKRNDDLSLRLDKANNYIMQLSSQVGLKPPYQTF